MSLDTTLPTEPRLDGPPPGAQEDGRSRARRSRPAPAPAVAQLDENTPTHTFVLPGGKIMRLATDRVRAKPAVTPQVSFLLGQNAIGLGLWGLLAPKGVNRFLGIQAAPQTTQLLFGAREMATGVALFSDPTRSSALWARVVGDLFDLVVLSGLNRSSNPKRGNARLALGVVLAVTALDVVSALRMSTVKRTCN